MLFDCYECSVAQGIILAHTLRIPGKTFKKGRVLSSSDVAELQASGIDQVSGVRLEAGDVDENEAALAIARALAGPLLDIGQPVAGRCNLYARSAGLVSIDRQLVDQINLCDSGIMIATLAEHAECVQQQAVASIKVIPFAVSRQQLDGCLDLAGRNPTAVSLRPFISHTTALILTSTAGLKESLVESTSRVTADRLHSMGGRVECEIRCGHSVIEVSAAIRSALEVSPDLILICGASITVDPKDIVPRAIVDCDGVIDHFGMPVEPGNMLLLAHIDNCPVINLPGCSRSPKLNGLDWVLQRLATGQSMGKAEILGMGVGGLIKDVSHRWRMRERSLVLEPFQSPRRVAALVLAAGLSRRMVSEFKLLAPVGGVPMITRVVDAALAAEVFSTTVVTGARADEVTNALRAREVLFVHNPDYVQGIASSLKIGLSSLPRDIDGVMILLADMPFVTALHINDLLAEFNPAMERDIVAPIREGRLGNPIIWSTRYIDDMMKLSGDRGARPLLEEFAANVWEVPMGDDAIFMDVDTPAALEEANRRYREDGRPA